MQEMTPIKKAKTPWRSINGHLELPQFEERSPRDEGTDARVVSAGFDTVIKNVILDITASIKGKDGKEFIEYCDILCDKDEYIGLQNHILAGQFDPATGTLVYLEDVTVTIEGKHAIDMLRFVCFIVEIYKRKSDILLYSNLGKKFKERNITGSNYFKLYFQKSNLLGGYRDPIDYYVSGKNPFHRLYATLLLELEDDLYH